MREIKFRAWVMNDPDFQDYMEEDASELCDPFELHRNGDIVLMQYTELKDKNGVEIYEGDVVEMISMGPGGVDLKGVVEMAEGSFYICSHENQLSTYLFNELSVIEIIGNIYEHPHLLEVSE